VSTLPQEIPLAVKISKFRLAGYLRPVAILLIPGLLVISVMFQNVVISGIFLIIMQIPLWMLNCEKCGTNIYFDNDDPYGVLAGIPHRTCSKCGADMDAQRGI
jgi:hypothetical protein